jgi:hypothetical protein
VANRAFKWFVLLVAALWSISVAVPLMAGPECHCTAKCNKKGCMDCSKSCLCLPPSPPGGENGACGACSTYYPNCGIPVPCGGSSANCSCGCHFCPPHCSSVHTPDPCGGRTPCTCKLPCPCANRCKNEPNQCGGTKTCRTDGCKGGNDQKCGCSGIFCKAESFILPCGGQTGDCKQFGCGLNNCTCGGNACKSGFAKPCATATCDCGATPCICANNCPSYGPRCDGTSACLCSANNLHCDCEQQCPVSSGFPCSGQTYCGCGGLSCRQNCRKGICPHSTNQYGACNNHPENCQ